MSEATQTRPTKVVARALLPRREPEVWAEIVVGTADVVLGGVVTVDHPRLTPM